MWKNFRQICVQFCTSFEVISISLIILFISMYFCLIFQVSLNVITLAEENMLKVGFCFRLKRNKRLQLSVRSKSESHFCWGWPLNGTWYVGAADDMGAHVADRVVTALPRLGDSCLPAAGAEPGICKSIRDHCHIGRFRTKWGRWQFQMSRWKDYVDFLNLAKTDAKWSK